MNKLLETWQPLERLWLVLAPLIIVTTNMMVVDNIGSVIAALCGILFVVLCAKGKWQGFIFGLIHCLLYGIISWNNGLIAEGFVKLCFSFPLHACALFSWYSWTCPRTREVIHQNLNTWGKFEAMLIMAIGSYFLGGWLDVAGGTQPYLDAITTVGTLYGAILMLKRCAEMWWVFFIVNVVSVAMWLGVFLESGNGICFLIMWLVWTINSIYGWINWNKT